MASHGKKVGIQEHVTAPYHHVPTGSARKKRRVHKDEIAEKDVKKIVKGGKMSKKGCTVSYGKCIGKSRNMRGCTSPRESKVSVKGKNGSRKEGVPDEVATKVSESTSQLVGSQETLVDEGQ
ncbi:hypothetical protein Tco_0949688 [Tanacetum coccineum]